MNYVAILVGALVPMILGFIWYHPKVMGTMWMDEMGMPEEERNADPNPMVIVGALVLAGLVSWHFSAYAGHTEPGMNQFVHGMFHGVMPALFLAVPVLCSNALFENKSIKHILINAAFWTMTLAVTAGTVYALTPPNPVG